MGPVNKILIAARDAVVALKIREAFGTSSITVCSPQLNTYEKDFDVLIVCFEPNTVDEQRWFHNYLTPLMKPNHQILWAC